MNLKAVMAVAVHCDDIEFPAGGTLLKYHRKFSGKIEDTRRRAGPESGLEQYLRERQFSGNKAPA